MVAKGGSNLDVTSLQAMTITPRDGQLIIDCVPANSHVIRFRRRDRWDGNRENCVRVWGKTRMEIVRACVLNARNERHMHVRVVVLETWIRHG